MSENEQRNVQDCGRVVPVNRGRHSGHKRPLLVEGRCPFCQTAFDNQGRIVLEGKPVSGERAPLQPKAKPEDLEQKLKALQKQLGAIQSILERLSDGSEGALSERLRDVDERLKKQSDRLDTFGREMSDNVRSVLAGMARLRARLRAMDRRAGESP